MSSQPILQFNDVAIGNHGQVLVEGLQLSLELGSTTFVIGPNGSGKTTLLRTAAGLQPSLCGEISCALSKSSANPAYLPTTIQIQSGVRASDIYDLLKTENSKWRLTSDPFQVNDFYNKPLHLLSSGEAKRVLLHATLSQASPMVILDEPANFLDINYRFTLARVIANQQAAGRSFLVSIHDYFWAQEVPKARGICLNEGRAITAETLPLLLAHPKVQSALKFKSATVQNPWTDGTLLVLGEHNE